MSSSPKLEEAARKRGCRECRRLKLGCERKWPCQNCRKRGCADICPDGTFTRGMRSTKGERLVMHETIGKMSARISQLEDAIKTLQSLVSTQPHPLLQDRPEQLMHPVVNTQPKKPPAPSEEEVLEALGAFSIGDKGETMFHEASATSEYLLINPNQKSPATQHTFQRESTAPSSLPPDLILLSALFPFPPDPINTVLEDFLPHLPPFSRARALADMYFANGAWSVDPVHREDFMHRVFAECYPEAQGYQPTLTTLTPDRLSVLFMVLAVGTFFDFEKPLFAPEAEEYYTLARATLCVRPVYDYPTVYAVQAMTLMMWFQSLAGHRTQSYRPLLWGVLDTVSQLMNLNRDPKKLHIEGVEAKVRELAFWEVKSLEHWQAFTSGRPAITSVIEDCKRPYDDAYLNPDAPEADSTVWLGWKQHFTDTVNTVADQAFRSKGTTYSQILALDKQLRHHHTPPPLRWPSTKGAMYQKLGRHGLNGMQCLGRIVLQESSLLHLHRWFFMQAVRERPSDPLEHQFAFSVRTVYQSASAVLMGLSTVYGYHPVLVSRCKTAWGHAFSAALTMGTLVISVPSIPLARPAMIEFEKACTLFQNTARSSVQPENAAAALMELQQTARHALENGRPHIQSPEGIHGAWEQETTSRSSQSPASASSQQSWPSNSNSSAGSPHTNFHATNHMHNPHPYDNHKYKPEVDQQWWDPAA